jgi:hypothetical protein
VVEEANFSIQRLAIDADKRQRCDGVDSRENVIEKVKMNDNHALSAVKAGACNPV